MVVDKCSIDFTIVFKQYKMEDLTADSFKHMELKKALFTESVDPDEEDTLNISNWKTGLSVRRSFSCEDVCDEDFYPPEVGKQLILRDPSQEAQAGNFLQVNVTSCSSWAVNSKQYPSERFARSVNQQCQELFVDFKDLSECAGFHASTPKLNRPFLCPTTPAHLKEKANIVNSEVGFARRDSTLFPMLLYSTTTANEFTVPKIVGKAKKQNTQKLEAGEISNDLSRASGSSKGNSSFRSRFDVRGCVDATLRTSVKNDVNSLNEEGELWTVQPPALEMDGNGKGRLLLVNKSTSRNLKFKVVFDGKLINVCPQSGNLKSKSQIGLRVILSRCINENACYINDVVEDTIIITCGKIEKTVPIKIRKVEKISKKKDRSFRCF